MYFKKFDDLTFADHYIYDPFGKNLPIYSFENHCLENSDVILKDKCNKKFFNATSYKKEKDVEISAFLEYIIDKKSSTDFTTKLDALVEKTKLNEIFRGDYMAWGLAEFDAEQRGKKEGYSAGVSDGFSQGIQQGEHQKAIETAINFLQMGISVEQVVQGTGLSFEVINELKSQLSRS